MNVLEKILEEIEERENEWGMDTANDFERDVCYGIGIAKEIIEEELERLKENAGWIPVEERLPKDDDMRFYMCIVENHEEDLPLFCQYNSECGFGFWHDMYDPVSLGFLDTEFRTNDELGYEKVIAWQPLPEPYKPKKHEPDRAQEFEDFWHDK